MDMGVADRSAWQVVPASRKLLDDFMIEPLGLKAGQRVEYLPLPASDAGALAGEHLLLVGDNEVTAEMAREATAAGAIVRVAELTADLRTIEAAVQSLESLDAIFISAGPVDSSCTLDTDATAWERLFDLHCKAPYYFVARALPLLLRSTRPRVVMVAPAPACSPESFSVPAVPCAVISQIRGLYVVGMAAEFASQLRNEKERQKALVAQRHAMEMKRLEDEAAKEKEREQEKIKAIESARKHEIEMVKVEKLRRAREEELLARKMEFVEVHSKKLKRLAEERAADEAQSIDKANKAERERLRKERARDERVQKAMRERVEAEEARRAEHKARIGELVQAEKERRERVAIETEKKTSSVRGGRARRHTRIGRRYALALGAPARSWRRASSAARA